jgi:hypothetical protein
MMITLLNDFHNTSAIVRLRPHGWLSHSQIKRIRSKLCGVRGCTCSNRLGMRGPQAWYIAEELQAGIRLARKES